MPFELYAIFIGVKNCCLQTVSLEQSKVFPLEKGEKVTLVGCIGV